MKSEAFSGAENGATPVPYQPIVNPAGDRSGGKAASRP